MNAQIGISRLALSLKSRDWEWKAAVDKLREGQWTIPRLKERLMVEVSKLGRWNCTTPLMANRLDPCDYLLTKCLFVS